MKTKNSTTFILLFIFIIFCNVLFAQKKSAQTKTKKPEISVEQEVISPDTLVMELSSFFWSWQKGDRMLKIIPEGYIYCDSILKTVFVKDTIHLIKRTFAECEIAKDYAVTQLRGKIDRTVVPDMKRFGKIDENYFSSIEHLPMFNFMPNTNKASGILKITSGISAIIDCSGREHKINPYQIKYGSLYFSNANHDDVLEFYNLNNDDAVEDNLKKTTFKYKVIFENKNKDKLMLVPIH
jgi:hypothetical protein